MIALVLAAALSQTSVFPDALGGGGGTAGPESETHVDGYSANNQQNSLTRYAPLQGCAFTNNANATEANTQVKMYRDGTLRNARFYTNDNDTNGNTVITLRKNGADTGITVTIGAAATGEFSDTSNTVTYESGDLFAWEIDTTASNAGGVHIRVYQIEGI